MKNNQEPKKDNNRISQKQSLWTFRNRIIAVALALLMVLAVFGTHAQMVEGADEASATSSVEVMEEEENNQDEEEITENEDKTDQDEEETTEDEETTKEEETTKDEEETTQTESKKLLASKKKVTVSASKSNTEGAKDISSYLKNNSYIEVQALDGKEYRLTADEQTGFSVDAQAKVTVGLYFDDIEGIEEKQTLVYPISDSVMTFGDGMQGGTYEDSNGETIGTYDFVHDDDAGATNIVFTIYDSYFSRYEQPSTETLTLRNLFVEFNTRLSDDHGENSSNDNDRIITLTGNGDLSFYVPFAYKNETGGVTVEKSSEYDAATRKIHYTITVTAPETNSLTAKNVKVTDVLDTADAAYIVADDNGNYYREVTPEEGTTYDADTNIWDIGEMAKGTTKTLTYDMVVSEKFFINTANNGTIDNTATVTFNDTGEKVATCSQPCAGTVLIDKSAGSLQTDDNGTYVLYTLKVTAYGGDVNNVMVKDAFDFSDSNETADSIKSMEFDSKSTGTGDVTIDGTSLTWSVGELKQDTSATMTYKVYINPEAWNKTPFSTNPTRTRVTFHNIAKVGTVTNPDNPDDFIEYDQDYVKKDIDKTWLNKTSIALDQNNNYQYTVTVNDAPAQAGVETISDTLTGGTYTSDVTLTYYNSSADSKPLGTYTIAANGETSFTIDLKNVVGDDGQPHDISGAYYYKLVYTANAVAGETRNNASIGGPGISYNMSITVLGSAGFDWNKKEFTKELTFVDYKTGDSNWKITVNKDIPAETMMVDTLGHIYGDTNFGGVYKYGFWWFTQDDLDNIEVKVGNDVLPKSEYTVEKVTGTSDENKSNFESTADFIAGFKLIFTSGVTGVSTDNPVTITYHVNLDYSAHSQYQGTTTKTDADSGEYRTASGWYRKFSGDYVNYNDYITTNNANWVTWHLKTTTGYNMSGNDGQGKVSFTLVRNVPLDKKEGTYDEDTGLATWDIEVNRYSSLSGDAMLVDQLPAGFTFVSAEIKPESMPSEETKLTYNGVEYTLKNTIPELGKITEAEVKNSDNETVTEVTIPIKNMSSFSYEDYTVNGKEVENTKENFAYDVLSHEDWTTLGKFTITVTAKVDSSVLSAASANKGSKAFTNYATLTDNANLPDGGVSAQADVTITSEPLLTKEPSYATESNPSGYESGSHIKYTLEVNPKGVDLVSGPDVVTIVDQIYSKVTEEGNGSYVSGKEVATTTIAAADSTNIASLETGKKNYLVVYEIDSEGNEKDITDQCTLVNTTEDDGMFKITVPDNKHLKIDYWVAFNGFVGDTVSLSNAAYFDYGEDSTGSNDAVKYDSSFQVRSSRGGADAAPSFDLMKVDQWGNPVAGVKFQLYEVVLENGVPVIENGSIKMNKVKEDTTVSKTTDVIDSNGKPAVDQNENPIQITKGMIDFEGLDREAIYCYKEISAPAGYKMDTTLNFVEFQKHEDADEILSKYGTVHDVVEHDAVLAVKNTFSGTSISPLKVRKTINGLTYSDEELDFTFTMKQTATVEGEVLKTVYTDAEYKNEVPEKGLTVTITGAGTANFSALYFKEAGTYTFSLTEDELSDNAKTAGYEQDQSEYRVTIEVKADEKTNVLTIPENGVTYQQVKDSSGNEMTGEVKNYEGVNYPVFNNTLDVGEGAVTINVKKILEGDRPYGIQKDEFKFILSRTLSDGTKQEIEGTTDENGTVTLTAPLTAADANMTLHFTLQEVNTGDDTITYYTKGIPVNVTTSVDGGAVVATDVQYNTTTLNVTGEKLDQVVEVVNTFKAQPPTGIYLTILPFALMAAFAAGFGVLVLVVVHRRKNKN